MECAIAFIPKDIKVRYPSSKLGWFSPWGGELVNNRVIHGDGITGVCRVNYWIESGTWGRFLDIRFQDCALNLDEVRYSWFYTDGKDSSC